MKKFFSIMMIAVAAFGFAACEETGDDPQGGGGNKGGKLATPELTETHTETSITVSWGAVENAEAYIVNLSGKTYNTEACEYTFEKLNAGKYTIRVGAKAEGYEDSDLAKIEVTLTGATSVDWFTQTVSLPDVDETVDYGNGQVMVYQPYNGVKALWKGTGVDDISYALFESATAEQLTDTDIKNKMSTFDNLAGALELINSEEGLEIIYGGCMANTKYTAYVWVKNTEGMEFFTKNEITTSDFDIPAETQAWIGTWNAKTSQILSINVSEKGEILCELSAQESNFTFTITASTYGPNMVVIDGLSVLGEDNPTFGYINKNTLEISTNLSLGYDANGNNYIWLPCVAVDGELLGLNDFGSEVPAHTLTMAEDGTVTGETGKFGVRFNDGTEAEAEVVSTDVFVITPDNLLSFPGIEAFPAVYRAGAMEVTKAATPTAKVLNKPAKNYSLMNTSVVLR